MNYEFLIVYFEAGLIYWVICFLLSIITTDVRKALRTLHIKIILLQRSFVL